MIDKDKLYVFYDGDCGFCNFWVQWILKNDKKDQFLFASLQGDFGQKFLRERNLPTQSFNTIYLWKPEKFYLKKSNAIICIAENLGGIFSLSKILKIFPRFLGDFGYDLVAKNRKKLITENCLLPSEEQRKKFIT